jgi:nitroimidazol reductase NimA-like FMN-containing flavoprotein (pyridoxamine 5'-phosphate oxidase superfamily)
MIRKDKEISDATHIEAIMAKANVCRLGMVDGGKPYIVPLCFGYHDKVLYFHSGPKGYKIDCIRKNPNVCFEFDLIAETMAADNACDWSMKYESVIGFGKAVLMENLEEKRAALQAIVAQYTDQTFELPENELKATAVIKVEIENMTGRHSGF